ncbi:formate dehydrogenase accessory sulfurtransferase FdhD [Flexithrix dorotheae]|uniref:formate dehydrogenase accessory sulfurtransferase FdhD n=1 Tax=Flexithrix dorotheae TaxID=70993 RepID=UPI000361E5F0|nr:formate dehydrogenase accessory sulfurtransferase FdhD [Flexithrix dorotheae]
MQKLPIKSTKIISQRENQRIAKEDLVVTEEPLEIIIGYGPENERTQTSLAITMRTPGHDFDLVVGFLFSEGIITQVTDISSIRHCENVKSPEEYGNVVKIEIKPEVNFSKNHLSRNFFINSSCGVCGKTSIESINMEQSYFKNNDSQFQISSEIILKLSENLFAQQTIFSNTGGLHAAGLFDTTGSLLMVKEDIGRHNALDKLVGWQLMQKNYPTEKILFLSGRVGFELVQKAIVSQFPIIAAVGAPSSLAVDLAHEFNITLVGFVKNNGFNIYAGKERITEN